jgi:hypothetical protein
MVPVGNPGAMADAIYAAFGDPGSLEQARFKASEFTIDRAVLQYLPLLVGNSE